MIEVVVSNTRTASMDPAPTANPQAKLVTEGFGECLALETPALTWSPITPPDLKPVEGSGWGGIGEAAVDKEEDCYPESKVADVLFDECWGEGNMPASPRGWLPGLAGHGGDIVGQGQQTSVVADVSRLNFFGGWTLPSLKDLGLEIYLEKRK